MPHQTGCGCMPHRTLYIYIFSYRLLLAVDYQLTNLEDFYSCYFVLDNVMYHYLDNVDWTLNTGLVTRYYY